MGTFIIICILVYIAVGLGTIVDKLNVLLKKNGIKVEDDVNGYD